MDFAVSNKAKRVGFKVIDLLWRFEMSLSRIRFIKKLRRVFANQKGMSLTELFVVLAIISLMILGSYPVYQYFKGKKETKTHKQTTPFKQKLQK